MKHLKKILAMISFVILGAITMLTTIMISDELFVISFTPNKMQFACFRDRFEMDQLQKWWVRDISKHSIEIGGGRFLGRYWPSKIHMSLDTEFFDLPLDKRVKGTEIMFSDIHYKSAIEAPVCATDKEDFVNLIN